MSRERCQTATRVSRAGEERRTYVFGLEGREKWQPTGAGRLIQRVPAEGPEVSHRWGINLARYEMEQSEIWRCEHIGSDTPTASRRGTAGRTGARWDLSHVWVRFMAR